MRSSLDQQGIDMGEIVQRHQVVIASLATRQASWSNRPSRSTTYRAPITHPGHH